MEHEGSLPRSQQLATGTYAHTRRMVKS